MVTNIFRVHVKVITQLGVTEKLFLEPVLFQPLTFQADRVSKIGTIPDTVTRS